MATRDILYAAGAAGAPATYIEDVFSTWLYTGNDSVNTITNGIDLAGQGGLVWIKGRSQVSANTLYDTVRGVQKGISSNTTGAQLTDTTGNGLTNFNSNGFTLGPNWNFDINSLSTLFASWTFRKQPKFFDVVTYTGDGNSGRTVSHSLGSTPGMIIVKSTSDVSNWAVYHSTLGATKYLTLNATAAALTNSFIWNDTAPTSTNFTVGSSINTNGAGSTYVAYLFAHNAGGFGLTGNDNVISCGSVTNSTGTGAVQTINLGYEPQYVLYKRSDASGSWRVLDVMRGFSQTAYNELTPNSSAAEAASTGNDFFPTATGMGLFVSAGATCIYMAIRRGPMKTPTNGTSVFSPVAFAGDNSATTGQFITAGFPVDLAMQGFRNQPFGTAQTADRLRGFTGAGPCPRLLTYNGNAEANSYDLFGGDSNVGIRNYGHDPSYTMVNWLFRRAPGFFDQVCYTGNGTFGNTINHNLGVAPELMIVKGRSLATNWGVYAAPIGSGSRLDLQTNNGINSPTYWAATPTATDFSLFANVNVNGSGSTYVAYLFATVAGVSKVGSYTGTGSTQTINAGLPTGARFVLIKRTDDVGNWWIWDTARGMVTSTDPRLALNSTAAEINNNWVYTVTNGFQIVTSDATVNASGGSYIYLAIA